MNVLVLLLFFKYVKFFECDLSKIKSRFSTENFQYVQIDNSHNSFEPV